MKNKKTGLKRVKFLTIIAYLFLTVIGLLCIYPLIFMYVSTTHKSADILSYPPPFFFGDHFFNNLISLYERVNINLAFFNSLKIALLVTFLNLFFCSLAGYSFAKYDFKHKGLLFTMVLITMMVPSFASIVPLYQMMVFAGIDNSHLAIVVPAMTGAFGIFLMRQNFLAIPSSIIESARVDGAGEWRIYFQVVLPLMVPALSALGVYIFMGQWANFLWPLIILSDESLFTLPVMLSRIKTDTRIDYGQIMIGASYTITPIIIVFFFLQKYFISGLTSGAVKE